MNEENQLYFAETLCFEFSTIRRSLERLCTVIIPALSFSLCVNFVSLILSIILLYGGI